MAWSLLSSGQEPIVKWPRAYCQVARDLLSLGWIILSDGQEHIVKWPGAYGQVARSLESRGQIPIVKGTGAYCRGGQEVASC